MSFNVSGLASGIDTNAFIESLMFSERAPVRRLEAGIERETSALNAWSDIQAKLNTLSSSLDAIRTGSALDVSSATSSDEAVLRVGSQSEAQPGTYAFRVNSLAAAQQVSSEALASATELVGAGTATVSGGFTSFGAEVNSHTLTDGTYNLSLSDIDTDAGEVTVTFDGVEQTVALSGGSFTVTALDGGTLTVDEASGATLAEGTASITVIEADETTTVSNVAAALNATGGPVRAQIIDTGDGSASSFRLVITSQETGLEQAADIDVSALSLFSGGFTTLREADDAEISLGDGSLTVSRSSNTIGDLFDGLSIDLVGTSPDTDVEIVVAADVDARVEAISSVVNGVNDVLSSLSRYSRFDVDAGQGGPLVGSFTARTVSSEVTQAMGTVVTSSSIALLSQIGITTQNDGTYSLDESELREALANDPAAVERLFVGDPSVDGDGVFDVISDTVDELLDGDGRILTAKEGAEATIDGLELSVASQEVRLEAVQDRYVRQFAALESLIGQLQSQSGYLNSLIGAS